jgi:PAB1-binding protein PBP1
MCLTKWMIGFSTDTDISQKAQDRRERERELQTWQPGPDSSSAGALEQGDDLSLGPGAGNASWDQFAANEKLFGVKTQFDEEVYTTKLDRSASDFKERERKAQRIANEIIGVRNTLWTGIQLLTLSLTVHN